MGVRHYARKERAIAGGERDMEDHED
jgi:hypothetical protein